MGFTHHFFIVFQSCGRYSESFATSTVSCAPSSESFATSTPERTADKKNHEANALICNSDMRVIIIHPRDFFPGGSFILQCRGLFRRPIYLDALPPALGLFSYGTIRFLQWTNPTSLCILTRPLTSPQVILCLLRHVRPFSY